MRDRYDILAVCYGGGHVNMVVAVVEKLQRSYPGLSVLVLGLTNAQPVLERHGIEYVGFRHLVNADDEQALTHGARLADELAGGPVPAEETVAYLGLSYADLQRDAGPEEAARLYARDGRQAFLPVHTLVRCYDKFRPSAVLTTSAPRAERAAVVAARRSGIPAVCMVDLFATREVDWLKDNDFADTVCVLSKFVQRRLVEHGRDPDHVVVTGNPAFDRLADPRLSDLGARLRVEKKWGSKFVILFASQPEPATHPLTGEPADPALPGKAEAALLNCIDRNPELQLVIRYHPSQGTPHRPVDRSGVTYSDRSEDLAVLLHAVDCVVTFSSTVGLEAALVGKPLIALQMSVTSQSVPYVSMGIAEPVDTLADLEATVVRIKNGENRRPAELPRPGNAADRVVDILMRHINEA